MSEYYNKQYISELLSKESKPVKQQREKCNTENDFMKTALEAAKKFNEDFPKGRLFDDD